MVQVNTKVHEATVSRIKPDIRVSTGLLDSLRIGLLTNPDPFTRLISQKEDIVTDLRDAYQHYEYKTVKPRSSALNSIRVDAIPPSTYSPAT